MTSEVIASRGQSTLLQRGQDLNTLALKLSLPFHRSTEWSLHACTPIRPGEFGNLSTYGKELASRIFLCAFALLFSPAALSLLAVGGLIDTLGDFIKQKPYVYWKGEKEQGNLPCAYTFFSLNSCMLWGGLPIPFGGVEPARDRIETVSKLILEQNADFVLLQEVSFGPAGKLYEKLKGHYAHFYTRISPSPWLMMDTALFVASKYPILGEAQFQPFPTAGTMKRGLFYFETARCWILATHLEAGSMEESSAMRQKQMSVILKTIQKLKAESNKPCMLLGDFNLARTDKIDDEYHSSHIPEHFYDQYAKEFPGVNLSTASCTERLTAAMWESSLPPIADDLIDYALVDKESKNSVQMAVKLVSTYQLKTPSNAPSDHRGLHTKIIFV